MIQPPNSLCLLLTSWRLYSATKRYISKQPQNFELDVAVINDHWIWPTWRVIPARTINGAIDKVEINLILCCTEDERHLQTSWIQASIDIALLYVLRYFLTQRDLAIHINTLIVNIDTTKFDNGNKTISEEIVPLRKIDDLAHLNFDSLYPIDAQHSRNYHRRLYLILKTHVEAVYLDPDLEQLHKRISNIVFHAGGEVMTIRMDTRQSGVILS